MEPSSLLISKNSGDATGWKTRSPSSGIYKGTDKDGVKISNGSPQPRPPACESALKMEGEAVLSRTTTARIRLS